MKPAFDTRTKSRSEYNALRDPNMRHYFQSRTVQSHLYRTGENPPTP